MSTKLTSEQLERKAQLEALTTELLYAKNEGVIGTVKAIFKAIKFAVSLAVGFASVGKRIVHVMKDQRAMTKEIKSMDFSEREQYALILHSYLTGLEEILGQAETEAKAREEEVNHFWSEKKSGKPIGMRNVTPQSRRLRG